MFLFLLLSDNDLFGACSLVCHYYEEICSGLEVRQVYIQDVVVCICFKDLAVHCVEHLYVQYIAVHGLNVQPVLCRERINAYV